MTRKEKALEIGLKLNQIHHLRKSNGSYITCEKCNIITNENFFYVTLSESMTSYTQKGIFVSLPKVTGIYCLKCAKELFIENFKKRKGVENSYGCEIKSAETSETSETRTKTEL
jgi:hypothetical protein